MRSKNTPLISLILKDSSETVLTYEWCKDLLREIDHEIIVAKRWQDGFSLAKGDFVCFLENDCVLSEHYFSNLIRVFVAKSSFRKLSMISPAIGLNDWDRKVFGYLLSPNAVLPSHMRSSGDFYMIQIGYIPGSLIRRSAIVNFPNLDKLNPILASAVFSTNLWENGGRIGIEPKVTYISTNKELDFGIDLKTNGKFEGIMQMFKQELVG